MNGLFFNILNYVIDFIFICDIFVSFRTSYIDDKGEEVMDSLRIAKKYLKITFWLDFLSVIPFDMMAEKQSHVHSDQEQNSKLLLFGILKFGRLLKIQKIIMYLNMDSEIKQYFNLTKLILFIIIYIHCYGCFWWFLVKDE